MLFEVYLQFSCSDDLVFIDVCFALYTFQEIVGKEGVFLVRIPGGDLINSGTVDEGETYEINMTKEVGEELGLKNVPLTLGPKIKVDGMYHHFTQWYTLQIDKNIDEFIFQKDEVEEIKWFTKEELLDQLKKNPTEFLPTMKTYFDLFNSK